MVDGNINININFILEKYNHILQNLQYKWFFVIFRLDKSFFEIKIHEYSRLLEVLYRKVNY